MTTTAPTAQQLDEATRATAELIAELVDAVERGDRAGRLKAIDDLVRVYARQLLEVEKLNRILARVCPEGWAPKGGEAAEARAA